MVKPLLDWYAAKKRPLPWRESPDPYRVWVSEIMLQQTRIETVIGYYARFIARLPDIRALAEVGDEELMKLWEGLGYYSRARNLKKAAVMIVERFGGVFPARYEDILSLPGVGEYTAGAIASIAFGEPRAAVDGNVIRVMSRLTESDAPVGDPGRKKALAAALSAVMPAGRCGELNEALMELGETVCLPSGAPLCGECPLFTLCLSGRDGSWARYPVPAPKKARKKEQYTLFLLSCGEYVAVRRRGEGLLGGLWELPNVAGTLGEAEALALLTRWGLKPKKLAPSRSGTHIFTHIEWEMTSFYAECEEKASGEGLRWVTRAELSSLALPTAFRKFCGGFDDRSLYSPR
ncbi:MAG: A/G-specific adenine glycosylase [Bacteroides sp.]|nr:A/G-specific adenine glycosylase [Bacteroides sp.]